MPYDASPYTKEELEALRHPPTKCVNLSDPVRLLATIDSIASRCEEAVSLLNTARIECEPLCPNGVSKTLPCECSRGRVAAFLDTNAAPPAPESKVERARREFYEAASDYYAEHDGVEIAGAGLNRVRTFMDACARLYAAERDAGRGA